MVLEGGLVFAHPPPQLRRVQRVVLAPHQAQRVPARCARAGAPPCDWLDGKTTREVVPPDATFIDSMAGDSSLRTYSGELTVIQGWGLGFGV